MSMNQLQKIELGLFSNFSLLLKTRTKIYILSCSRKLILCRILLHCQLKLVTMSLPLLHPKYYSPLKTAIHVKHFKRSNCHGKDYHVALVALLSKHIICQTMRRIRKVRTAEKMWSTMNISFRFLLGISEPFSSSSGNGKCALLHMQVFLTHSLPSLPLENRGKTCCQ